MTQQTAAATSADPAPNGAADAPPSGTPALDQLLAEFDQPKPGATAARPDATLAALKPVIEFASQELQTRRADAVNKAVDDTVGQLLDGEQFKGYPKDLGRAYLELHGAKNPAFSEAFNKRATDPDGWKRAFDSAKGGFQEFVKSLPGSTVRTDIEAAVASVQGATTAPAPKLDKTPIELGQMNDWDYAAYKKRVLAKQAGANRS